jgi:exosortase/archaeosortase family protein
MAAAALAWCGLAMFPGGEIEGFARGAAALAALFTGAPLVRVEDGWLLAGAGQPVVVTAACSATGYFVTVAALLAWRLALTGRNLMAAVGLAVVGAVPLTLAVNGLRVVVLMQAHRWIIPRFPAGYGHFLHLLVGVGVFLPLLIGLNLILEYYGSLRQQSR